MRSRATLSVLLMLALAAAGAGFPAASRTCVMGTGCPEMSSERCPVRAISPLADCCATPRPLLPPAPPSIAAQETPKKPLALNVGLRGHEQESPASLRGLHAKIVRRAPALSERAPLQAMLSVFLI